MSVPCGFTVTHGSNLSVPCGFTVTLLTGSIFSTPFTSFDWCSMAMPQALDAAPVSVTGLSLLLRSVK